MNYRLYSFVANHYLSPLQCGLQTAHVVSELFVGYADTNCNVPLSEWANNDKTIIICAAGNHVGVVACYHKFVEYKKNYAYDNLPYVIFREDRDSMNGMATACGIIVPEFLYDAQPIDDTNLNWQWVPKDVTLSTIKLTKAETEFCKYLKSFRLA